MHRYLFLAFGACACLLSLLLMGCQDGIGTGAPNLTGPTNDAIVYMTYAPDSEYYSIGLMRPDGSDQHIVINGNELDDDAIQGSLSPDGTGIIFSEDGDAIRLLNLTNGELADLYRNPSANVLMPSYSPDGQQIVFSHADGPGTSIYIMDADGSDVEPLLLAQEGESFYLPVFSPDGTKILFQDDYSGDDSDLYIMNADGSGEPVQLTEDGINIHGSFLPDGRIIFIHTDFDAGKDIWVMDADGGNAVQLTNTPNVSESYPTSNAAGTKIAYAINSSEIYVADFNGTTLETSIQITDEEEGAPCWRPAFGSIIDAAWQPL